MQYLSFLSANTNNRHVYKVDAHRKFATQRRSHTMNSVPAINSSSQKASQWSSVTDFYTDRDIFVTGGTGFMGKCLLEKLLRSIPGEGKIFVLVRQKKGKSVQERVEELTNSKVFSYLLKKSPDILKRLVPVEGDLCQPGLGISQEETKRITDNVSVIFHLAATIRFHEHIKKSLQFNVLGVREVVQLARQIKDLKCLVHVSTAFCNCQMQEINEIIYQASNVNYKDLLNSMSWMTDEQFSLLTPSLLRGRPNTYTLTKAMAENLLQEEASDLPVAIIRPSIIGAAAKEPLPGWVDCTHGPAGIFVAIGKGLLRVMQIDWNAVADIVPVDFVNNMLLAIGWVTAMNRSPSRPLVYHCNTGSINPINWGKLTSFMVNSYTENPFDEIFRRPCVVKCRPFVLWPMWQFFLHYLPAYLTDCVLGVVGKKRRTVSTYKKLEMMLVQLSFFTQRTWQWSHLNYDKLLSLMSEEDRETYNFDMSSIQWGQYISTFCMGTKKYLLKDDISKLAQARQQIRRHRNIRYLFSTLVFLSVGHMLFLRSRLARETWFRALSVCMKLLNKVIFRVKKDNELQVKNKLLHF